ncbi:MAG: MATE family efflux transporter [Prevotella sp.]|nr:MATE family efflux transporter [Prevotella sp.]
MNDRDRQILGIALPAIVTNITVPLLGMVDTAIVGHMGAAAYIGAVAVGSMIFNLVYWVFGFLRMGTSGLTAQARGRRDLTEVTRLLVRSASVSMAVALALIVLQWPLCELMLSLLGPTADVRPLAATYFYIVVWGAPASLGLFALTGWFIGMQNTRLPMLVSICQNVVNILASLLLVYGLDMKIEGVALGTVVAQYGGVLLGVALLLRYYRRLWRGIAVRDVFLKSELVRFFRVNRDIFLRTVFLVAVNFYFTSAGARQGAVVLAVNTLLLQLYLLFSYVMDGFAYAGEALGGRYWGAGNRVAFSAVVERLFRWGALMVMLFTAVYVAGGMPFLHLLTDEPQVVAASREYVWWAYLIPLAGVAAFVWDGIFIGITQTRGMLQSSLIAAAVFFVSVAVLTRLMGNHGLWLSMLLYLFSRGLVQTIIFCNRVAR